MRYIKKPAIIFFHTTLNNVFNDKKSPQFFTYNIVINVSADKELNTAP